MGNAVYNTVEIEELQSGEPLVGRTRRPEAGRKPITESDPHLVQALEELLDEQTRGDPESPLRWTCKSMRRIAQELAAQNHPVSYVKVAQILHGLGYSLQGNRKTEEGKDHPDRDAQFRHINRAVKRCLRQGVPVISVDTKNKELVGNFHNAGRQWRPEKQPLAVQGHDFPGPNVPRAYPYGIYDIGRNVGFVNVGTDHDTGAFAVASIRGWWRSEGRRIYPNAKSILITADGGGSNGWRLRLYGAERLRVPLSSRDQQVEQDRASAVLVHLFQLARRAPAGLRNHRQSHRRDHHRKGTESHLPARPAQVPDRPRRQRRRDEARQPEACQISRGVELLHQATRQRELIPLFITGA
jgi:Rhodopirellula transposase DDE domain